MGVACIGVILGCSCSKRSASEQDGGTGGAGGAGEEAPLGQDGTRRDGEELVLEVLEVSVEGPGAAPSQTSFVTGESITVRGRVRNGKELEERIQWSLQPVGTHTQEKNAQERCRHFRTLSPRTMRALEPTLMTELERGCRQQ